MFEAPWLCGHHLRLWTRLLSSCVLESRFLLLEPRLATLRRRRPLRRGRLLLRRRRKRRRLSGGQKRRATRSAPRSSPKRRSGRSARCPARKRTTRTGSRSTNTRLKRIRTMVGATTRRRGARRPLRLFRRSRWHVAWVGDGRPFRQSRGACCRPLSRPSPRLKSCLRTLESAKTHTTWRTRCSTSFCRYQSLDCTGRRCWKSGGHRLPLWARSSTTTYTRAKRDTLRRRTRPGTNTRCSCILPLLPSARFCTSWRRRRPAPTCTSACATPCKRPFTTPRTCGRAAREGRALEIRAGWLRNDRHRCGEVDGFAGVEERRRCRGQDRWRAEGGGC